MAEKIFELNDIYYSYLGKFPALQGLTVEVARGELVTVIGANGSGKSTLLQLLDGLIFPDRGKIKGFGEELNENLFNQEEFSRYFRRKVGLVFQDSSIQLFCPTVEEDILFGPAQLGLPELEIGQRLKQLTDLLGIQELLNRSPHRLSLGERKKVALASTLIGNPDVLLLDEPTAGLDPATTRHIIEILIDFHRQGKTLVISTHDLHLAEELGGTIHVFGHEKQIIASGKAEDILGNEALLQANNLAHSHVHRHGDALHAHPHSSSAHHRQDNL
jgi:cobalt/nickel transport system ATP-binding protein